MKFSHSIQFNAVPDWANHYIAYSNLKKLIYQLEKQINQRGQSTRTADAESSPLLNGSIDDPDKIFTSALDVELEKICAFFRIKELELYGELDQVLKDEADFENDAGDLDLEAIAQHRSGGGQLRRRASSMLQNLPLAGGRRRASTSTSRTSTRATVEDDDDSDHSADERAALQRRRTDGGGHISSLPGEELPAHRQRRASMVFDLGDSVFPSLYEAGVNLKKRIVDIYVSLCELRSYIQLNRTGFTKVLKKYDKILGRSLKNGYIERSVEPAAPFVQVTMDRLNESIEKVEKAYSRMLSSKDENLARRELRLHLREHVVWERNTVWREMIGIERRTQAANMGLRHQILGPETDPLKARLQGDVAAPTRRIVRTPFGRYNVPLWLLSSNLYVLIAICAIFVVMLYVPIMEVSEQQNCLAMVVVVSLLWATEAIPLFVSSLLVPLLVVTLRVVRTDDATHRRLGSKEAAKHVFAAMWTPVIMLLLGGFTIAAALSKHNIAKKMATFVLSKAGTSPKAVLLTSMSVATFASMWISNVAAPVLCFSIIQPILRNLPADSDLSKAFLLGIALASNIGGMASPIASPQNLIALQNMNPQPGWGVWFFIAIPISIISIIVTWILLLMTFRPGRNESIVPIRAVKEQFTGVQWFISIVTILTIILWVFTHQLEPLFGDMGVIALIPLILFFGTGVLTKEDFNNFLWTIIILAAGGLALGNAVNSSGLLHTVASAITDHLEGLPLYFVLVALCTLILVVATFISHTVAALIFLPLVQQVGLAMDPPHPNMLVMGSVLMCSAAMGLPTSGFPNMTAIMMEDPQTGQRYLRVSHFITRGVPASILVYLIVITLGYGLMLAVGF